MNYKAILYTILMFWAYVSETNAQKEYPSISNYLEEEAFISSNGIADLSVPIKIVNDHILWKNKIWSLASGKEVDISGIKNWTSKGKYYIFSAPHYSIFDISLGKIIYKFGLPYYKCIAENNFFNKDEVLISEINKVFLFEISSGFRLWEKEYKGNVIFSRELKDGYLVMEEIVRDHMTNCYLYEKESGKLIWKTQIGSGSRFTPQSLRIDGKCVFVEIEYKIKGDGFSTERTGTYVKFLDLKNGSVHTISEGSDFYICKNKLYVTDDFGTNIFDVDKLKPIAKFASMGSVIAAFDDKLLYSYFDDFKLYSVSGEVIAEGFYDMNFYKVLNSDEDHYDEHGDGYRPFELFFSSETDGKLIAFTNMGGVIIFKIIR
ncbi:hypothetical protein RCC89_18535 [Cytophagaceae bacterium ABcell3]|nr:hypothetical protein RCC89_18535 [Cytophagaceae bacterium ABcell3]